MIVAELSIPAPGGDPEPPRAVAEDGPHPHAAHELQQVVRFQVLPGGRHRPGQRHALQGFVPLEHDQPRIGAHKQLRAVHAGGVDDLLLQAAARKQVQKPVRHNLHHALAGGGEPQVALIVRHHAADQLVHRHVFQLAEAAGGKLSDAVHGADPDVPADGLQPLRVGQRADLPLPVRHQGAVRQKAVVQAAGLLHRVVERAGLHGIRQEGQEAAAPGLLAAQEAGHRPVAQGEQVPSLRDAVGQAVAAHPDVADHSAGDPLVLQHRQVQLPVNHGGARRGPDVHDSLRRLRDGPDADGGQLILPVHPPEAAPVHEEDAEVVGADPQAVLAVHIQAPRVQDAVCGLHDLKGVPVVADQAGIAADPDEAVAGLGDRIGLGGGQAVAVVIQDGGKALRVLHRVHRGRKVHIAAGIEDRGRVLRPGGRGADRGEQHGKQQAAQPPAAGPSDKPPVRSHRGSPFPVIPAAQDCSASAWWCTAHPSRTRWPSAGPCGAWGHCGRTAAAA